MGKNKSPDSYANPHHSNFRPMPNRSYYEMPLTSMMPKNAVNMESIGLKSRGFDLEDSIKIIAPCARRLIIKAKIQFYKVMKRALAEGTLTKEQFLKSTGMVWLLVRDHRRKDEDVYRLATQYLQVKEYDSGLNVVSKSVETICDGMTPVTKQQALNPLFLSENIGFKITTMDNEELTALNDRFQQMVLSDYYTEGTALIFKGKARDIVDSYIYLKNKGIEPVTKKIGEMVGLKYRSVTTYFRPIKEKTVEIVDDIFPQSNIEAWEKVEARHYLDILYNIGLLT